MFFKIKPILSGFISFKYKIPESQMYDNCTITPILIYFSTK